MTHGYRSLLSLRVPGSPGHCSVLSLYARAPQAFDDGAILAARLFGLLTATLLHGLRDAEGLRVALATRDVIGQAKGVLAERCRLSDDEAFRLLVETSQQRSSKLVDVARGLVDEARRAAGALPLGSTAVPEGRLLAPGVRVPPPGPRRPRGGAPRRIAPASRPPPLSSTRTGGTRLTWWVAFSHRNPREDAR